MSHANSLCIVAVVALFALCPATVSAQAPPPNALTPPGAIPPTTSPTGAMAVPPIYHDPASRVDVYTGLTEDMFPAEWHAPNIAATALPIAATDRTRALRLIKVALSKYPSAFLQANLRRVYLIGNLKFRGVSVAATNSTARLFVVVKGDNPLYTDAYIENSFHHEFAHLLQRNYWKLWSADTWAANNPPGFHYGSRDGVEAVRSGHASTRWTDEWSRLGFVSEYGSEAPEEDFATIASKLLLGDTVFWSRVDKFPALAKKVAVAMAFYGKLDGRFTEAYFRSLRVGVPYVDRLDTRLPR